MRSLLNGIGAQILALAGTVIIHRSLPGVSNWLDCFLIVVVYYAIGRSRVQGLVMGATAGLLQDIVSSGFLGFHAFVKTAVAYLVGGLGGRLILNQPFPQFLSLFVATFLDAGLTALLALMAGLPVPFEPGEVARRALVNSIVGLILFRAIAARSARRGLMRMEA